MIDSPTFTPVTASATVTTPEYPSYGLNIPTSGSGVVEGEALPILAMESLEPLETEDGQYLFQEG